MEKIKKIKLFSLATATIIGSSLVTSGELTANASSDTNTDNIQGAYYYIDGVEYEVPTEEITNFVSKDNVTNLPHDYSMDSVSQNITPTTACDPTWVFSGKRTDSGFQLGKSGTKVINKTKDNLTEVSSLSTDTSVTGKVTGKSGVNWGVIKGEVGFEIGGSVTWKTHESTSITVRPGDWGWIDYGAHTETCKGEYYYVTNTCKIQDNVNIEVKGPKYKAKLAKTEKY
ncbi:hypothetical protein [Brevibacillus daliensis]|uniref:hypothetical protein n=1 Tax=Brevibacillus daliensis TaxID=2892995 RepID=UPI001E5CAB21|nr:hypothetical protein [Brevibacillus daliensis]